MRKTWSNVDVTCVCLMALALVAAACSPQDTSTGLAVAGSPPIREATPYRRTSPDQGTPLSRQATPSPTTSFGRATPVGHVPLQSITEAPGFNELLPWPRISQGVQSLGFDLYPNIYLGGEDTGHHALILYLGPGDDTPFLRDLHAFLDLPIMKASGIVPKITVDRVPVSPAGFEAAKNALLAATPRLRAKGFVWSTSGPNFHTGTYDVSLYTAPKGTTAKAATAYLRKTVSSLIRVTTVHAPPMELY